MVCKEPLKKPMTQRFIFSRICPKGTSCIRKLQFIIRRSMGLPGYLRGMGEESENGLFTFLMLQRANIKGKLNPKRKRQSIRKTTEIKVENSQVKNRGLNLTWYCYFLGAYFCSQNSVKALKKTYIEWIFSELQSHFTLFCVCLSQGMA